MVKHGDFRSICLEILNVISSIYVNFMSEVFIFCEQFSLKFSFMLIIRVIEKA